MMDHLKTLLMVTTMALASAGCAVGTTIPGEDDPAGNTTAQEHEPTGSGESGLDERMSANCTPVLGPEGAMVYLCSGAEEPITVGDEDPNDPSPGPGEGPGGTSEPLPAPTPPDPTN